MIDGPVGHQVSVMSMQTGISHGLGVPVGVPPPAPHCPPCPDWFPKWTEPSFWAGGPLSATQNAEPSTVTAFELHIFLEIVDAVVGSIPSVSSLDGAI